MPWQRKRHCAEVSPSVQRRTRLRAEPQADHQRRARHQAEEPGDGRRSMRHQSAASEGYCACAARPRMNARQKLRQSSVRRGASRPHFPQEVATPPEDSARTPGSDIRHEQLPPRLDHAAERVCLYMRYGSAKAPLVRLRNQDLPIPSLLLVGQRTMASRRSHLMEEHCTCYTFGIMSENEPMPKPAGLSPVVI